jgi:hypothetical protein
MATKYRLLFPWLPLCCAAVDAAEVKFVFGSGEAQPGYTRVTPQTTYDAKCGFGFLQRAAAVTDQPNEPCAAWGQMLPRFFRQGVAVSNQADFGLACCG